ncbi:TrmB family transcriptional regulator [Alkalicoccobacillus gibsonii]
MLQKFGFTQYESQVYSSLITVNQALDASTIVKRSGVPRTKVYEVINRLVDKGILLETTVEKKRQYAALPLDAMIEKLQTDFESSIEELKKVEVEEMELDNRVWTLKDHQSISSLIKDLVEAANNSIVVSMWAEDLELYLPILETKYKQDLKIVIQVIGNISTTIPTTSTLIPNENHELLEPSQLIIIDETEMLFAGVEEHGWQAILTKSPPLVKYFTDSIYHDIALTKITDRYHETVMKDDDIRAALLNLRY